LKKLLALIAFSVLLLVPSVTQEIYAGRGEADLDITKTDGLTFVNVGGTLTYSITASNAGPNTSGTGITISDTLPNGVTVNGGAAGPVMPLGGPDAGDWSCLSDNATPQLINCTTSVSIPSSSSSTFSFTTDAISAALAGATLTNSIQLVPDPFVFDPSTPNLDTDDTTVGQLSMAIGGKIIPIDTTMVLLAGSQMTASWMIPVIVAGIGFAIVIARKF